MMEILIPMDLIRDSQTPQNTPSSKKTQDFSLKNIDFSKIMANEYDSNVDIGGRNPLNFCVNTYVGNSKLEPGCTHNVNDMKICNNLLCTKCDCKVSMFKDQKWCNSCDYLFFRNNYGDSIKLSEKLNNEPGTICYSCQCTWLNVDEPHKNVENLQGIDWICNGHHS